jgi:hypothetical protein
MQIKVGWILTGTGNKGLGSTYLVKREPWITWNSEVAVESYVLDFFLCLSVCIFLLAFVCSETKMSKKGRREVLIGCSLQAHRLIRGAAQAIQSYAHPPTILYSTRPSPPKQHTYLAFIFGLILPKHSLTHRMP